MGRLMQALDKEGLVILETTPVFLIHCTKHLPKEIRYEFPLLLSLDLNSEKWIDELQQLKLEKISILKKEIDRLQRILNKVEFVPNVNAKKILKHWTNNEYNIIDINTNIDSLKNFLIKSIELDLEIKIYL